MIHDCNLSTLSDRLGVSVPGHLIQDDIWRLENAWYGNRANCENLHGVALYLGGRSGLEIALAHQQTPGVEIHVVEFDKQNRERLVSLFPFAYFYSSLNDFDPSAFVSTEGAKKIDLLRISAPYYADMVDCLKSLEFPVVNLAVELPRTAVAYDEVVYLRHRAKSVFVRHGDGVVGFDTPAYEYDVSVVVPAYGVEKELGQCLDSLAEQTLGRVEIIVVDDGSPDRSGEIADSYAANYPGRVRVIHQANAGCAAARAAGMAAARGEFVGFVDGDDWVDLNMFKHLHMLAVMNGTDIAQCGFRLEYNTGETVLGGDIYAGDGPFRRSGVIWNMEELFPVQPTIWRRIYRKSFLDSQGITFPPHIRRFDDLPFQFECFAKTTKIATTPEPYYAYRQGRPGQDIMVKDDRLFVHFPIFDYIKSRVLDAPRIGTVAGLLQVELNTHLWALRRIEKKFTREYRRRAIQSLRAGYSLLGSRRVLKVAGRAGKGGVKLAFRSLIGL